jgi:Secretion system C-terminal sorting domain
MKRCLLLLSGLLFVAVFAHGQIVNIINTVVGTPDDPGYLGDGGPANAALLYSPSDITFDRAGNMYITDFINNVIRLVDTTGNIYTIAGTGLGAGTGVGGSGSYSGDGGPATAADLNGPFAIALDNANNIIFADGYNHVVRRVDASTGVITTIAGQRGAGYSGDGGPATMAKLDNPVGIAIDKFGNIYIGDDHNNVVRMIDGDGIITTVAGNNTAGYSGDGGAATSAQLSNPVGVGVDTAGNLYIADAGNSVIRKVTTTGIISTFAGNNTIGYTGDNGPATAAQLDSAQRVNFDDSGNVYISDIFNNVVRKVNTAGIITTFAGIGTGAETGTGAFSGDEGPADEAELYAPEGVAQSPYTHAIYIVDRANDVIRMVAPGSLGNAGVTKVSGSGQRMQAFPNPTTGAMTVNVSATLTEPLDITVLTMTGITVATIHTTTNAPTRIDISEAAGMYMLHAQTPHNIWNKLVTVE